jgi:hypothetical protein
MCHNTSAVKVTKDWPEQGAKMPKSLLTIPASMMPLIITIFDPQRSNNYDGKTS